MKFKNIGFRQNKPKTIYNPPLVKHFLAVCNFIYMYCDIIKANLKKMEF